MGDTKLNEMIQTVLDNIRRAADVNTLVGEPMQVGDTKIIPVSKVSMGFTAGGLDYTGKHAPEKGQSFGGGSGAGFNVTPIAFLVVDAAGGVSLISVDNPVPGGEIVGTISSLVDKAPGMIDKIVKLFKKDKKSVSENPEEPEVKE